MMTIVWIYVDINAFQQRRPFENQATTAALLVVLNISCAQRGICSIYVRMRTAFRSVSHTIKLGLSLPSTCAKPAPALIRPRIQRSPHSRFQTHFSTHCPLHNLTFGMSSAEGPSPPQAAYAFAEITAESISKITQEAIARARTLEDRIGTLAASQCTFDAVVRPLALEEARMDVETDSGRQQDSLKWCWSES